MQRALSFLVERQKDELSHRWHVAVSDTIFAELVQLDAVPSDHLHVFAESPSHSRDSRRRLRQLEQRIGPDGTFTFAGPAYVRFESPHLMGCTEGWVTHATLRAYRTVSFPHRWAIKAARAAYKGFWFRQADAWVVQTESARQGLSRRCRLPRERIAVVPNSCSPLYFEYSVDRPARGGDDKWTILCFAAAYPHKRLEFIPTVAKQLRLLDPALKFQFVLTLPPDSATCQRVMYLAKTLSVTESITNEGAIPFVQGPALYARSDICFLPTVLETFSANYPEAMAMNVPIVTTDLGFARDVCQDAALYFQPDDAVSAARQLQRVIRDGGLRQRLVTSGKNVFNKLPSPRQQYRRYTELLTRVATRLPVLDDAGRT